MSSANAGNPSAPAPAAAVDADRQRRGPSPARRWAWLLLAVALIACASAWWRLVILDRQLRAAQAVLASNELRNAERDHRLTLLEQQLTGAAADDAAAVGAGLADPGFKVRRDAMALTDIERLLDQAQVQLRLGVAPASVLDVLQYAQKRLTTLGNPRAVRLSKAIQADLDRLKSASQIDRFALAARIDAILPQVDQWRPLADAQHAAHGPLAPAATASHQRDEPASGGAAVPWTQRWRSWISAEFGDLIRIQPVLTPEALQLAPAQQQVLRDRVRFALMNLRQGLVVHDPASVRNESLVAEQLIGRYFDSADPGAVAALAELRSVAAASAQAGDLSLTETVSVLRSPGP